MDNKRLILAAAGSGKTYYLVSRLNENKRFLLITYTISGTENLRKEVIKAFGYLPPNIKIINFFSFLYSICYKPFLKDEIEDKGISWKYPQSIYDLAYTTKGNYLYHNRISKLIKDKTIHEVKNRLRRYFDHIFVDEIQDFAGNDFDFLMELFKMEMEILMVGDFFQHTFDTSRDKQKNKSLHNNYHDYIMKFSKNGVMIDNVTLSKSRRCSKQTCEFINERLGIIIESEFNHDAVCKLVVDKFEADSIINDDSYIKLFLQKHYDYNCLSDNWGACKGLTYKNVCVVINNDTLKFFKSTSQFAFKSTITKNKFYVACSRPTGNLIFLSNKFLEPYKKVNTQN